MGTSTFAIIGNENIEIASDDITQPVASVPQIPWIIAVIGVVCAMILIFAFLFKANILYMEEDKKEGNKPDEVDYKQKYENIKQKEKFWKKKK